MRSSSFRRSAPPPSAESRRIAAARARAFAATVVLALALAIAAGPAAARPARAATAIESELRDDRDGPCYALTELGCPDPRGDYGYGGTGFRYYRGSGSGGRRLGKIRTEVLAGVRYFTHYNRQRVVDTPPETLVAEGQLQIWYKNFAAIYFTGGAGVAMNGATIYGVGTKLPFLSFNNTGNDSGADSLAFSAVIDYVHIGYPNPVAPDDYPTALTAIRYGISVDIAFGSSPVAFNLTGMVTYLNNNFFIAPLAGISYRF